MIAYNRVWAVVLRHARLCRRDPNVFLFTFYWPILDILIWGFLGVWISQQSATQLPGYQTAALLGILLWQFIGRGANTILASFHEELWSQNLINLFAAPLDIMEWIAGILIFYIGMILLVSAVCFGVILLLYDVVAMQLLAMLALFCFPFLLCGIWVGFMCLQVAVIIGRRGVEVGYVIAWLFLPLSGAYYPITALPDWAQTMSRLLPMSYLFEAMRAYVMYGQWQITTFFWGLLLSLLYAAISIVFFIYAFYWSKTYGLARLTQK